MSTTFTYFCGTCQLEADGGINWGDTYLVEIFDNRKIILPVFNMRLEGIEFDNYGFFEFLNIHKKCEHIYLKSEYGDLHPLFGHARFKSRPPWIYDDVKPPYYPPTNKESDIFEPCLLCQTKFGDIRKIS